MDILGLLMSILVYSCGECILTPTSGSMNSQSPTGDVVIYRLIHLHLLHWSTIVIVTGYLSFHAYITFIYYMHCISAMRMRVARYRSAGWLTM